MDSEQEKNQQKKEILEEDNKQTQEETTQENKQEKQTQKSIFSDEEILQIIETAKATGKLKKGANEVTKAIEKEKAKLVVVAKDVNPKEIIMHIPLLCKEKNIPFFEIGTREELGSAAGLSIGTSAVAVINGGEAEAKIKRLTSQ